MQRKVMRIAVFGTGGIGGYFGGRLATAGEDVVFIARGAHLEAIRERGLQVDSVRGDFLVRPAQATDDPESIGIVDLVIVAVKSWQVTEVARSMAPLIGPETLVLPLENGVDAPAQLAEILGRMHVLGGLAKIFSSIAGPGHIRQVGGPASVTFGELDSQHSERVSRIQDAFGRAGIEATVPVDIQAAMWEKFLLVVPFGGLGAVARAPIGVLRSLPETRQMLEQGMREVWNVAREKEIMLPGDILARAMDFLDGLAGLETSSMQRDIAAGRPSELEAWNGAVVRLGREAGVYTPLNDFVYHSLLPLELRARGQLEFDS
jgi:2-dehydropantoate 2-reductase